MSGKRESPVDEGAEVTEVKKIRPMENSPVSEHLDTDDIRPRTPGRDFEDLSGSPNNYPFDKDDNDEKVTADDDSYEDKYSLLHQKPPHTEQEIGEEENSTEEQLEKDSTSPLYLNYTENDHDDKANAEEKRDEDKSVCKTSPHTEQEMGDEENNVDDQFEHESLSSPKSPSYAESEGVEKTRVTSDAEEGTDVIPRYTEYEEYEEGDIAEGHNEMYSRYSPKSPTYAEEDVPAHEREEIVRSVAETPPYGGDDEEDEPYRERSYSPASPDYGPNGNQGIIGYRHEELQNEEVKWTTEEEMEAAQRNEMNGDKIHYEDSVGGSGEDEEGLNDVPTSSTASPDN